MQESKCKLVIFSDIHYVPERPIHNLYQRKI